jgi:hypothetical protein
MKLVLLLLFFHSFPIFASLKTGCKEMFDLLEKDRDPQKSWLYMRDMKSTAQDFEKSYRKYSRDLNYKKCLYAFLGKDQDKYYWIALFLSLKDYTAIQDLVLAEELLNRSIRMVTINCEVSHEKNPENYEKCTQLTSAHAMLGYLHWQKKNKIKSEHHFKTAEEITIHNPGGWPALDPNEMEEIRKEFKLSL